MSAVAACRHDSAPLAPSPVYQPRRSERTATYQAVQARKHRHRYHGVLAAHSPLRPAVTAYAGLPLDGPAPPATGLPGHRPTSPAPAPAEVEPKPASPAAYLWPCCWPALTRCCR